MPSPHTIPVSKKRPQDACRAAISVRPRAIPAALRRGAPRERAARSSAAGPRLEELGPAGFYARRLKRAFDLSLILVFLPLVLAVSLPVALANLFVFRDPRRILFDQARVGRHGRVFRIYKFRTMKEARGSDYESWSEDEDRLRVTRFGRLLRNTHLDELPQLLNVLRGEMSIVGPRPEMVEIEGWAAERVPGFRRRLALRPGITGWAQITQGYAGRDVLAYRQKLRADERYRLGLGFRRDLGILWRTVFWVLRARGWRPVGEPAGDEAPAGVPLATPQRSTLSC